MTRHQTPAATPPTGARSMARYGGRKVQRLRRMVWDSYPHTCHWCKRGLQFATFTVEHLLPRSLGGDYWALENCRPACGSRASGGCGENFARGNGTATAPRLTENNTSFFKI